MFSAMSTRNKTEKHIRSCDNACNHTLYLEYSTSILPTRECYWMLIAECSRWIYSVHTADNSDVPLADASLHTLSPSFFVFFAGACILFFDNRIHSVVSAASDSPSDPAHSPKKVVVKCQKRTTPATNVGKVNWSNYINGADLHLQPVQTLCVHVQIEYLVYPSILNMKTVSTKYLYVLYIKKFKKLKILFSLRFLLSSLCWRLYSPPHKTQQTEMLSSFVVNWITLVLMDTTGRKYILA